jgi:ankyrin repeat protein
VHQKAHWKEHKPQYKNIKQALALPASVVDARFRWSRSDSDDPTTSWTYLAFAVVCGLEPLARHLLDLGADKEIVDDQGRTPLCVACEYGTSEMAKLLVERGAHVNIKTNKGHTPLSLAVNMNHSQLATYLRTVGALVTDR